MVRVRVGAGGQWGSWGMVVAPVVVVGGSNIDRLFVTPYLAAKLRLHELHKFKGYTPFRFAPWWVLPQNPLRNN